MDLEPIFTVSIIGAKIYFRQLPKSLGIPQSLLSARLESFFSGVLLNYLMGQLSSDTTFLKEWPTCPA